MPSWTATGCSHSLLSSAPMYMLELETSLRLCTSFQISCRAEKRSMICLANLLLDHTNMVTLKSHRNQLTWYGPGNALQLLHFSVQAQVTFEFGHIALQQNVDQLVSHWAIREALCKVEDGRLRWKSYVCNPVRDMDGDSSVSDDMVLFVTEKHFMLSPWQDYIPLHFHCF